MRPRLHIFLIILSRSFRSAAGEVFFPQDSSQQSDRFPFRRADRPDQIFFIDKVRIIQKCMKRIFPLLLHADQYKCCHKEQKDSSQQDQRNQYAKVLRFGEPKQER